MSTNPRYDQRGMASFLITLIMLGVITLIVVGFTQVSNRNRRQALDRQLSSRAFYAAESGVNQAAAYINTNLSDPTMLENKDDCTSEGYGYTVAGSKLSPSGDVSITCVLVNSTPPSIETVGDLQKPSIIPIDPRDSGGTNVTAGTLTFTWTSNQPVALSGCDQALGTFVAAYTDCTYGLLRVDLFQYQDLITSGADNLAANAVTIYFQPGIAASSVVTLNDFTGQKAYIVGAYCTADNCAATVDLPASAGGKRFYARILSMYNVAPTVNITGTARAGGPLYFSGQYVIDVTGRAQDVLRRVSARYNPTSDPSSLQPTAGIQTSGDICKRFTVVSNDKIIIDGACN